MGDTVTGKGGGETPAHTQKVTHTYTVNYPAHEPRESDPHYKDFAHYRNKTKATAKCAVGEHRNDFSECEPGPDNWPRGLELHHTHVEFAVQNGVDLKWLAKDYPGIDNPDEVGAWVESANNLTWLCTRHHRTQDGVHRLSASDWEAQRYVRNLIAPDKEAKS